MLTIIRISLLALCGWLGCVAYAELATKQEIRIGNGTEPRELDPHLATGVPESHIIDNLFEGLCSHDPFTLEPLPGVAESWQISKDGTVYTFKLRKNLKWSDGKKLDAHDFVYSWRRVLDPKTASEYSYQLHYIKNGKPYNEGKIKDAKKLGVVAKDANTLVVTLERPTPYFLSLVAFHILHPVPKHVVTKHEGQKWTKAGNMVSNGPFKLAEWRLNKHIKLIPNPHYWDKAKIKIKSAYFLPIENTNTEEKAFISGQLDMTNDVASLKIPYYKKLRLKDPQNAVYRSGPLLGTYFYRFNLKKLPFGDKRVRRALGLVIDRQLIVDKITKGGEIPAGTFVPPKTAGYTHTPVFKASPTTADLAEAKRLLKEAGYPNGKGFPKIELLYNTSEGHKKVAVAIQQMWKKNLGIRVSILNQEWKVFLNSVKELNYQTSRGGWIGDYLDPNTFLDMYVTGGGHNNTGWSNKKYDEYIRLAAEEQTRGKRLGYFHKAEDILLDELPIIPIYHYVDNKLVSPKVKMFGVDGKMRDWVGNLSDRIHLKYYAIAK